jgi:predicted 3-demethylubiquinone-9 3-methyltransferase (glyoxalase superfamily)
MQQRITPNLWFDTEAEEAAEFYTSVFKDSRIVNVARYTEAGPRPAGTMMIVEFELDGQRFVAINGGPQFKFSEAVSFQINCETQDEIDYYWQRLSEGGKEGQCGWLKDKYGLSWQVTPTGMEELFAGADPERARRAMQAMLGMGKLDIAALRSAAEGVPGACQTGVPPCVRRGHTVYGEPGALGPTGRTRSLAALADSPGPSADRDRERAGERVAGSVAAGRFGTVTALGRRASPPNDSVVRTLSGLC